MGNILFMKRIGFLLKNVIHFKIDNFVLLIQ